jgi:hypothetical protein
LLIIIAMLLMLPAGTVLLAGMHGGLGGAGATAGRTDQTGEPFSVKPIEGVCVRGRVIARDGGTTRRRHRVRNTAITAGRARRHGAIHIDCSSDVESDVRHGSLRGAT